MRNKALKFLAITLAALFVFSASIVAGATFIPVTVEDIEKAADTSASLTKEWFGDVDGVTYDDGYKGEALDESIIDTLALYKAFREGNYLKHGAESVALQRGLFAFYYIEKALDEYNARATMLDAMEDRMLIEIVAADVTLKVCDVKEENDKLVLAVNEWTFFDYDDLEGEGDAIDASGYGVDHTITLVKCGGSWLIETDYFEDTLMGLPSPEGDKASAAKTLKDGGLRQAGVSAINGKLTQKANYTIYSAYNPTNAVAYSEKWVYHSPTSGNYESYYNPEWPNYNSVGGDCANYTSQSIYAGGMPMAAGAVYGTDGWFHYSSTNRSASWTGAKQLRTYMSNARGKVINSPSNSQVWMGCPMFVDWYSDGSYDHAYFCVGQNSSGTAIINSHNSDKYHVKWNYGYSSSTYSTVQITTSNHAIAKTVSAPSVTVSSAAAYGASTSVSWAAVTNATSYKYKVVSYKGEMSATSATTLVSETSTTGTSFSFTTPASGKYCKVTVTAVGPDNSASTTKNVMIGPWEARPTTMQYIPVNDINGDQWTTGGSTVWTSSIGKAFTAVWWTAALCTANSDGSYTVSSVYAAGGSSKNISVSGTNILVATHSSEAGHQYTAALKVGDKITLRGVYLDTSTIRGSGYALVNGGVPLTVTAPTVTAPASVQYGTTASVSWSAVKNATSYNYTVTNGSTTVLNVTGATATSFTIPAQTTGTSLTVSVTAVGPADSKTTTKTISLVSPVPTDITTNKKGIAKKTQGSMTAFTGYGVGSTASEVIASFDQDSSFLQLRDKSGNVVANDAIVSTGYTINVVNNNSVSVSYTIVIKGDVIADGSLSSSDYVAVMTAISGLTTLGNAETLAADVSADDQISSTDYIMIMTRLAGTSDF